MDDKIYAILCNKEKEIVKTKRKKGSKISLIQIIHVFQVLADTATGAKSKEIKNYWPHL